MAGDSYRSRQNFSLHYRHHWGFSNCWVFFSRYFVFVTCIGTYIHSMQYALYIDIILWNGQVISRQEKKNTVLFYKKFEVFKKAVLEKLNGKIGKLFFWNYKGLCKFIKTSNFTMFCLSFSSNAFLKILKSIICIGKNVHIF